MALSLEPPAKEMVPPGCTQLNPQKTGLFVTEKQPTSIAIGRGEPVPGGSCIRAEVQRLFAALCYDT